MLKAKQLPHGMIGLPEPLPFESPASWVTRAALSQGETVVAFLAHLDLPDVRDFDLAITSGAGRRVLAHCGVSKQFSFAVNVFGRLKGLGTIGPSLLLTTREGWPRSRFCPRCLATRRESCFEIHCRFIPWRFCPLHHCLLEDACPHCRRPVVLPFDMVCAGIKKSGVAYLSKCQWCEGALVAAKAVALHDLPLSEWDWMLLKNGRATLAALRQGVVRIDNQAEKPLSNLKRLARMGALPMRADHLTADGARQALATQASIDSGPRYQREGPYILLNDSKSFSPSGVAWKPKHERSS